MAMLLYGSGLRLLEMLCLRVKDIDFGYGQITIRDLAIWRARLDRRGDGVLASGREGPVAGHRVDAAPGRNFACNLRVRSAVLYTLSYGSFVEMVRRGGSAPPASAMSVRRSANDLPARDAA